jgi:hypothetical protein
LKILRPEASMSDLFRSAAELTWLRKFGLTESAARRASLVLYPIDPRFPVEQAFAHSAQELALEFARDSRRVTDGAELEAMAVEKLNVLMRFAWLFQNSDYVRIYGGALGRDSLLHRSASSRRQPDKAAVPLPEVGGSTPPEAISAV